MQRRVSVAYAVTKYTHVHRSKERRKKKRKSRAKTVTPEHARAAKHRSADFPDRAEFVARFREVALSTGTIIAHICKALDISRKTFYQWMDKDEELRMIYVEAREATDDIVESELLKNIQKGDQRAIEFYLTNRRSTKWRSTRLFQERDSEESLDIQELFARALSYDIPAPGSSGPDAGVQ